MVSLHRAQDGNKCVPGGRYEGGKKDGPPRLQRTAWLQDSTPSGVNPAERKPKSPIEMRSEILFAGSLFLKFCFMKVNWQTNLRCIEICSFGAIKHAFSIPQVVWGLCCWCAPLGTQQTHTGGQVHRLAHRLLHQALRQALVPQPPQPPPLLPGGVAPHRPLDAPRRRLGLRMRGTSAAGRVGRNPPAHP